MTSLARFLEDKIPVSPHLPWPRVVVDPGAWSEATARLGPEGWTLIGLWGEPGAVHMAVLDPGADAIAVLSLACPEGRFPSVGRHHAPAIRPERAIRDLYGLDARDAEDRRPWLDHGRWGLRHPLGDAGPLGAEAPYEFRPAEGEGLHRIPVGPVHAGIIEPGHFRFTVNGETVVRLEQRLGYVHKGIDGLLAGAPLDRAARIAARLSGDSTVASSFAFARAVESAIGIEVPARAAWLRALMAELERIANHLGDVGAICNDAAFSFLHAKTGVLREAVLRASARAFGHRLMMDRIVPGGVAVDPDDAGIAEISRLLAMLRREWPPLVTLYDERPSLQDRTVGTGHLSPDLAAEFGAGGYVGRASGRDFDARRLGYAPYGELDFEVPVREEGDVNARVWIRILEIRQSLALIGEILARLPVGPARADVPAGTGEGLALVEGFRGDILAWVRLDGGIVARCHLRDPSWFQWPLLEAAIEGNIVADFPLCNKSFNCSYAGQDL
jgi:Ni,Fe-hydrogenase III large subunit